MSGVHPRQLLVDSAIVAVDGSRTTITPRLSGPSESSDRLYVNMSLSSEGELQIVTDRRQESQIPPNKLMIEGLMSQRVVVRNASDVLAMSDEIPTPLVVSWVNIPDQHTICALSRVSRRELNSAVVDFLTSSHFLNALSKELPSLRFKISQAVEWIMRWGYHGPPSSVGGNSEAHIFYNRSRSTKTSVEVDFGIYDLLLEGGKLTSSYDRELSVLAVKVELETSVQVECDYTDRYVVVSPGSFLSASLALELLENTRYSPIDTQEMYRDYVDYSTMRAIRQA